MFGDAGANDTQIVLALIGFFSLLVTTVASLVLTLRVRTENRSAHTDVARAIVHTHDAVAKVAEEIAPPGTTPVVEPVAGGSE